MRIRYRIATYIDSILIEFFEFIRTHREKYRFTPARTAKQTETEKV